MTQEQFDNARAEGRWMDILKEAFIRSVTGEISMRTTLATVATFFGSAARHITHDASVANILRFMAAGTDSNIDVELVPKGTGGVIVSRLGKPIPYGRNFSPLLQAQGWVGKVKTDATGAGVTFPAVAPSGLIYIGSSGSGVRVFNPAKNAFEPSITAGAGVQGIAYCPSNNRFYVANSTDGTVSVINPDTGTVVATIPLAAGLRNIGYVPSIDRIYVGNSTTGEIRIIVPSDNTVAGTITGLTTTYGFAYCPSNDRVYVGVSTGIAVINPTTATVVTTIAVGDSRGLAYCPTNDRIYAGSYSASTVRVIDPSTNTSVANITAGMNPWEVAFNPVNGHIYVCNFGSNTVSVIRPSSNVVAQSVAVNAGPVGLAFSPHDGLMVVANVTAGNLSTLS